MNFHNMTQKNLFESYIPPSPVISRCYSSKANTCTDLPGNALYLGSMRHFNRKNPSFGPGHLKMPPLEHRTEFCDPLVKIVGGFVGSKSQAGTSIHRGREVSLWDVIVDKIIETMENPEPRQQAARKSAESGKKNGKIQSFTMIGVGQFGPDCPNGSSFDCLSTKWYPPAADFVGSVGQNDSPKMGGFHDGFSTRGYTEKINLTKNSEPKTHELITDSDIAAYCSNIERPFEVFKGTSICQEVEPSSKAAPSCASSCSTVFDYSPVTQVVEENGNGGDDIRDPENTSPCRVPEKLPDPLDQIVQSNLPSESNLSPASDDAVAAPKHVLRPEAAEFTPRIPCRPSLESESEDDSTLLSTSCESQTPSDTFLRPKVQRTLSECSVDSDDSFIVFESTEDDPVIVSEDWDDEDDSCSEEDLDEIDNPILFPHNLEFSQPSPVLSRLEEANKKWAENYSDVNPKTAASVCKKVKFAEGRDLVKVKHLIAWGFAHRAARIGPWEMYHRDAERFKSRVSALSAVLSPVLAKRHREKIYSERFQA